MKNILFLMLALQIIALSKDVTPELKRGLELFTLRCGACHPLRPPPVNGPPLWGIISHATHGHKSLASFEKAFLDFIQSPDSGKATMPEAIAEYGLMPKMDFDIAELKVIAAMMWKSDTSAMAKLPQFISDRLDGVKLGVGGRIFAEKCGACHSFNPPPRNGPPARGMTRNYARRYGGFSAFQKAFIRFVQDPADSLVVMTHAQQRFGPMPKMDFNTKDLEAIARWLWDTFGF